jgi:hypothetical protein
MRRLMAQVALAAMCSGPLLPLFAATQLSTVYACCVRRGKHHCQESSDSSGGYEFRAVHNKCPYSVPTTVIRLQGLHATKFDLSLPSLEGDVAQTSLDHFCLVNARASCARGPPSSPSVNKALDLCSYDPA